MWYWGREGKGRGREGKGRETMNTSGTCAGSGCFSSGSRELSRLAKFPTGFGPVVIFVVSGFCAPIFLGTAAYGKKVPTRLVRHFILNWSGLVCEISLGKQPPAGLYSSFRDSVLQFSSVRRFLFPLLTEVPSRSERYFSRKLPRLMKIPLLYGAAVSFIPYPDPFC